ncbi:MAG TPA: DUF2334 domain-containing protein [Fibrobacteraceae bacterium]|nr:DUF2334 domain-containing protein [Fibrobacteraceae bacterium]
MAKKASFRFLAAYHDVSNTNMKLVEQELLLLAEWGLPICALGIIPGNSVDTRFREFVQRLQNKGYELLLHGYLHQAQPQQTRHWLGHIALSLTGGEAEFAGLNETDSKTLLENAIRAWDLLALGRAAGFVPPTWIATRHLTDLSLKVGWNVHESRFKLHIQKPSAKVFSIPVSLAGLTFPWRTFAKWTALHLVQRTPGIPRLVFHPGDVSGRDARFWKRLVHQWLNMGARTSYSEL